MKMGKMKMNKMKMSKVKMKMSKMKRGLCLLALAGLLTACGQSAQEGSQFQDSQSGQDAQEGSQSQDSQSGQGAQEGSQSQDSQSGQGVQEGSQSQDSRSGQGTVGGESQAEPVTIRVGSLKGPTTLGILSLMDRAEKGETYDNYEFRMATGADELLPLMVQGDLDIALVPANVAAVLYQRTQGGVAVIDINTLGVLYVVTGSSDISSIADLEDKTIYLTGMGTTPEASLRYVLQENGLSENDYTLEFKSEATEVAAVLAENPEAIGLLPQPFVTAALMQNSALQIVLDLNEEWNKVQGEGGSSMVTGVTLVRRAFLEEQPQAVEAFLEEHRLSVDAINKDPDTGAALAVEAEIVAKEPIAKQAIPNCNIVCITGEEMQTALSGYLQVLEKFEPSMIGGQVPGEDFYFRGQ